MGLLSFALNSLGLVLLAHAIYSAHEHTALLTPSSSPSSSSSSPASTSSSSPSPSLQQSQQHKLPTDIVIELVASVLLVCVGVVLASPKLQPIEWARWGGEMQREGPKEVNGELRGVNPYAFLEERRGFWDVRKNREEFANWVRDGAKAPVL